VDILRAAYAAFARCYIDGVMTAWYDDVSEGGRGDGKTSGRRSRDGTYNGVAAAVSGTSMSAVFDGGAQYCRMTLCQNISVSRGVINMV
jgi:hypothetical protein